MQLARLARFPASHNPPKRSTGRRLSLLLSVSASCALSGCALLQPREDPTRFYVLTAPGAQADGEAEVGFTRWKVGLRRVEVPAYLRSKAMAVRTGTNEIHFAEFDRWAEPLDQGIGRVMKETLRSARNVENVALNSHGDDTLDYEVTIRILACEGVRAPSGESSFRFAATWELRSVERNSTVTRCGLFTAGPAPWSGKDYGQLAERLSGAIAGVSKAVAAELPMGTKTPGKTTTKETTP